MIRSFVYAAVGSAILLIFIGCTYKLKVAFNYGLSAEMQLSQIVMLERYGKSFRGEIVNIPCMVLRGSYQEIGEAHGYLGGGQILQLLNNLIIPFVNSRVGDRWDSEIIPKARTADLPENYRIELSAIITGIRNKFSSRKDRMLHALNRGIGLEDLHAMNCLLDIYLMDNCSSFSAWGQYTADGKVILAGRENGWPCVM